MRNYGKGNSLDLSVPRSMGLDYGVLYCCATGVEDTILVMALFSRLEPTPHPGILLRWRFSENCLLYGFPYLTRQGGRCFRHPGAMDRRALESARLDPGTLASATGRREKTTGDTHD